MTGHAFCTGTPFAPWHPAQTCALSSIDCAGDATGSSATSRMDTAASRARAERVDIGTSNHTPARAVNADLPPLPTIRDAHGRGKPGHVVDCPKLPKTSSRYSRVNAMMALPRL